MVDLILFPSSYFNVSKVDEDLQAEYDAVKATGLFDVILFGYDKWFEEDQLVIKDIPQVERTAVYRGYISIFAVSCFNSSYTLGKICINSYSFGVVIKRILFSRRR